MITVKITMPSALACLAALGKHLAQCGQQQRQQGGPADRVEQAPTVGQSVAHGRTGNARGGEQRNHAGERETGQGHLRLGKYGVTHDRKARAKQRDQQRHQRNKQRGHEQSVAKSTCRLPSRLVAHVLRMRHTPHERCQQREQYHAAAGQLRGQQVACRLLCQHFVAAGEKQAQQQPECGAPALAFAQMAQPRIEQKSGDQPVGIFNPQHAQPSSDAGMPLARRCSCR
jgi:hypothetical protein